MNTTDSNTHCCRKRRPLRQWLIGRKLRKMKLDDDQAEKLDALFASARTADKESGIGKNELRAYIGEMITDQAFDPERAAERINSAAQQHAERMSNIAVAFGEFYQGLEPWQQQQLQALWHKRRHCVSRCCH